MLTWGDTFRNFLNEVGAGEAEDVLKEHGIVSVDDLVRVDNLIGIDEHLATLPLSEKPQERLSLGIQMEQLRRAMEAHARRHAAGWTSTSGTPQPAAEPPAISQTPAEIALAKEVRMLERKLRRLHATQNMLRLAVAPDPFEPVLAEQLAAKLERKAEAMSVRIAERHSRSATLGYLEARSKVLDYASAANWPARLCEGTISTLQSPSGCEVRYPGGPVQL